VLHHDRGDNNVWEQAADLSQTHCRDQRRSG
jgi:hypothetical protein